MSIIATEPYSIGYPFAIARMASDLPGENGQQELRYWLLRLWGSKKDRDRLIQHSKTWAEHVDLHGDRLKLAMGAPGIKVVKRAEYEAVLAKKREVMEAGK